MPKKKPVLVDVVKIGRKGGRNSRKNLSPADATKLARHALNARWARWRRDNGKEPKPGDEKYLRG